MDHGIKLSPEYQNAVNMLDRVISNTNIRSGDVIPEEIKNEGTIVFLKNDFKSRNIPAGEDWRWNQAKSRRRVVLPQSANLVEFYKLMPRPLYNQTCSSNFPKRCFKIWRFDVYNLSGSQIRFRALWCEKGIKNDATTMSLEDFRFLSPFMDPNLAEEIWPLEKLQEQCCSL